MLQRLRVSALCLLAGATLFAVLPATVDRIFGGMCSNAVFRTVASPDGQLKAVLFDRDCGATTGGSTQISVLPIGEILPNEGGNLFIAHTNHGVAPYRKHGGGPEVSVRWTGQRTLLLRYHSKTRVFRSPKQVTVITDWISRETITARYETTGKPILGAE